MEGQTSSYVLGHERCLMQKSLTAMMIVAMQEVGGTQVDHSGRLVCFNHAYQCESLSMGLGFGLHVPNPVFRMEYAFGHKLLIG